MGVLFAILLIWSLGACGYLFWLWRRDHAIVAQTRAEAEAHYADSQAKLKKMGGELAAAVATAKRLSKWETVANADEKAKEILREAESQLQKANLEAAQQIEGAKAAARTAAMESQARADAAIAAATTRAAKILDDANEKAQRIAGSAMEAVRNKDFYEQTARAMRNIIEGYGDEYLIPGESLLDQLAVEYSHKEAGQRLKEARNLTRSLIKQKNAAKCDYKDQSRREGVVRFVVDAFNGKVDSALSRVRHDNFGKLEQEINDAFFFVNYEGKAFGNAQITDEYLAARIDELRWAVITFELQKQEREEQRKVREQIREEEKARRDYERAMREAQKEEDTLRKAMAKAQAQIDAASAEQRSKYEAQLSELQERLKDAEEKNQRAVSMAQLTRRGHVYIISNTGSFGEGIYKIGLTRRLEPMDRIDELGDASVPFDFDVHAIMLSDDAPALELRLHKHFLIRQVNKINHRKEFYRLTLTDLREVVESLGIEAKWTMTAEAREYRESMAIERMIAADPAAREAWINRQLTLDPVDYLEMAEPVASQAGEPEDE